ncbi:hypothetical protein O181_062701 [Austropuccinia psidii MF-1]|uniref:Uncharacterized protein n=1 Tax=Austropuccinia psidii MF-1 TaxID=1389203 RepID=A0A9Q3HYN9_9BASI|nr:hypothetical protein [Austropuccinia psidii MF-1]
MDHFLATLVRKDASSVVIVILQTIDDSTESLLSKNNPSPESLFSAIKLRCNSSSRLDKLDTVRHLIASFKDTSSQNTAEWLNLHQEIFAKLVKWEVSLDELYGLLLQANSADATSGFVVPVAVVYHNESISAVAYTPPTWYYQQPVASHNPIFQAPQPASGSPSNPNIPDHVIRRAANIRICGQSKVLID